MLNADEINQVGGNVMSERIGGVEKMVRMGVKEEIMGMLKKM